MNGPNGRAKAIAVGLALLINFGGVVAFIVNDVTRGETVRQTISEDVSEIKMDVKEIKRDVEEIRRDIAANQQWIKDHEKRHDREK